MWLEIFGTIFGVLCVWLTVRQNIWCWPTGLIQVILFIFIFYEAKLYSDLILHGIYVGMQIYGWYHWLHGGERDNSLPVSRQSSRETFLWAIVAVLGGFGWGHAMATFTDAAVPYLDAFIVSASLIAQWLMARKKLESWFFWIAVDVVAIGVYFYKKLYVTTALYSFFLVLAVSGYVVWKKAWRTAGSAGGNQ